MWHVQLTAKANKQVKNLPIGVQQRFDMLAKEMEVFGPIRAKWKNFGKLKTGGSVMRYHCHIKSGRPTYVVCWDVLDKEIKFLEIIYVGTHEKAPY